MLKNLKKGVNSVGTPNSILTMELGMIEDDNSLLEDGNGESDIIVRSVPWRRY